MTKKEKEKMNDNGGSDAPYSTPRLNTRIGIRYIDRIRTSPHRFP